MVDYSGISVTVDFFFLKTVLRYKSQVPMLLTSSLGPLCTSTSSGPDTRFGGVPWVLFFDDIFKLFFVYRKDIYFACYLPHNLLSCIIYNNFKLILMSGQGK